MRTAHSIPTLAAIMTIGLTIGLTGLTTSAQAETSTASNNPTAAQASSSSNSVGSDHDARTPATGSSADVIDPTTAPATSSSGGIVENQTSSIPATRALADTSDTDGTISTAAIAIPNGDFEAMDAAWVPTDWTISPNTIWVTDAQAHGGSMALQANQWNYATSLTQTLTVAPGNYDLSLFVWAASDFGASSLKANGQSTPISSAGATQIDGSLTWDEIVLSSVVVGDDGQLTVSIDLAAVDAAFGNGYLDDLTIRPSAAAPSDESGGVNLLTNPGFEDGRDAWQLGGTLQDSGHADSTMSLAQTGAAALDTYQLVTGLANGSYTLQAFTQNNGCTEAYLFADQTGQSMAKAAVPRSDFAYDTPGAWKLTTLRGIEVTDGQARVGLHSANCGTAVVVADDFRLFPSDPYRLLLGGDITELNYVEDLGGQFYDAAGQPGDPLQILADAGWNLARIRAYNDPGPGHGAEGYYTPAGYQNLDDALKLAKRAQAAGMAIEFSLHYSDYWTNPGRQLIPAQWAGLIDGLSDEAAVDILEDQVYQYTLEAMQALAAQGTTPAYVSLGNETRSGMLLPFGSTSNWDWLARFYNAGAAAVRAIAPDAQVIIHLDDGGNTATYLDYFSQAQAHGVDYDIIGSSYYPSWTRKSAAQFADFAASVSQQFAKPIIIMETGYNWNPEMGAGGLGQLTSNGPYGDVYQTSTPAMQRDFLIDQFNALQGVSGGLAIGSIYWDPVMIYAGGQTGWANFDANDLADNNVVDNTTLFDFDGRALPALQAYTYSTAGSTSGKLEGRALDANGEPVVGATITISCGEDRVSVTTNRYGAYFLPQVTPGRCQLAGTADGLGRANATTTVLAGPVGDPVDLHFAVAQSLADLTGSVVDDDDQPLPGVTVRLTPASGPTLVTLTDEHGQFSFTAPTGDGYQLSLSKDGFLPASQAVDLSASGPHPEQFQLSRNAADIAGLVHDGDCQPLIGALVSSGAVTAITDQQGRFTLKDVPAGSGIIVTARAEGHLPASSQPLTVEAARPPAELDFSLPEQIELANPSFEAEGQTGYESLAGWTIEADPAEAAVRQNRDSFGGTVDGQFALSFWDDVAFTADIHQTISAATPGDYVIQANFYTGPTGQYSLWAKNAAGQIIATLPVANGLTKGVVELAVSLDQPGMTLGISALGAAGDWAVVDDLRIGFTGLGQCNQPTPPTADPSDGPTSAAPGDSPSNSTPGGSATGTDLSATGPTVSSGGRGLASNWAVWALIGLSLLAGGLVIAHQRRRRSTAA